MDRFPIVEPIIVYPTCLKSGRKQDCFNCVIGKKGLCNSPRGMCIRKYHGHPKGCPNYGKKDVCPPNAPMFDQVFDLSKPIYLIYSIFDIGAHAEKMRKKHPDWTEIQQYNLLYWQGTARKELKKNIKDFKALYEDMGYYVVLSPDAMGVNVNDTLKKIGIVFEWPARKYVYKIAMGGIPLSDKYLSLLL